MPKGGALSDIGDVLFSGVRQEVAKAQMYQDAAKQRHEQTSSLQQLIQGLSGEMPSQDLSVGNSRPGSVMSGPMKIPTQVTGNLDGTKNKAPSEMQKFMPNFLADKLPGLAMRADPEGTLAAVQARLNPAPIGKVAADERYFGRPDPVTGVAPIIAQGGPKTPEPRKVGDTRTYQKGGQKFTDQWNGTAWDPLGNGPEWQPDQTLVEIADNTSPTGTRMVPRGQAINQPGKGANERTPAGYRTKADGTLEFIPGGPADPKAHGTRYNNEQNLAAGFAGRMDQANNDLQLIASNPKYKDFDPTSYVEEGLRATNASTSEANQLYRQAQENWVSANLRRESGAAIGKEEMEKEVRKYFPQAGDKAPLVDQKARSRMAAEQSMQLASGGAYDQLKTARDAKGPAVTAAPQNPADRKENSVYQTPKGPMTWTRDGWFPAK